MKLTTIPAHYRPLGENETIRKGDYYYCILDQPRRFYRIQRTRVGSSGCTPLQWLDYRFFRRKHVNTKPLTPTRIALNSSVKHWNRLATGTSRPDETTGLSGCALCQMFFKNNFKNNYCDGCPISNFTGFSHCEGSPYRSLNHFNSDKNDPRFKKAAAKFRDWLKQLPVDEENV